MTSDHRPQPSSPAPGGFEHVAVPDPDWRVITGGSQRCRAGGGFRKPACGAPAVARMKRRTHTRHGVTDRWWAYCGEHMYGRWVEDRQVMVWVLRERAEGVQ